MFFPFWITGLIFILGSFLFDNFYFGIFVLFFMDIVYGFDNFLVGPFWGAITFFGILVYLLINIIKHRLFSFRSRL